MAAKKLMEIKTTPLDSVLADLTVRENLDPYLAFFYLRSLFEAFMLSFNSNPSHQAILDPQPPDYSHGFILAWEDYGEHGDQFLPLLPDIVVKGLHSKTLWQAFTEQFNDGMPLHALVSFVADRIQDMPFYRRLSAIAAKDFKVASIELQRLIKEVQHDDPGTGTR